MRFVGRWLTALALAGVTLVSACGGPPPEKRSTEELLAIGQDRLDEIAIPPDWQLLGKAANRSQGKLHWDRDYKVNTSPEAAVRALDEQILAAGWSRRPKKSCLNGAGVACWMYDKGGLTITQTALPGSPCPAGHPICADVSMYMRQNYKEPI